MQNIINILERHRVPVRRYGEHHHTTKNWVQTDCPSCSIDVGKFRLGWEIDTGRVSCWQCGKRDPVSMLAQLCHIPMSEAYLEWRSVWKLPYAKSIEEETNKRLINPIGLGPLDKLHLQYLRGRNLPTKSTAAKWELQGIAMHHKLPWRLFIPIHDKFGRQVSWTTRSVKEDGYRKYITASPAEELVSHKSVLYGYQHALHAVIVVEGPVDVWAIGPGAVATFGLGYTQRQVDLIAQYPIRVVCFDVEQQAQRKADKLCTDLSGYPGITHRIRLVSGADPATCDKDEIARIRAEFLDGPDLIDVTH